MAAPQISYEATISPDEDGEITCLVYQSVDAGVCGPHGETYCGDLATAEQWLKARGYVITEPWRFVKCYDGMRLMAELTR